MSPPLLPTLARAAVGKRVFFTGATGFIGGNVLSKIVAAHPELEVTALLRSPSHAFSAKYNAVKVLRGSFDDSEIIQKAAQDADIVVHTGDVDHLGCVRAILSGLSKRTDPSFLVHLSGTGCVSDEREQTWEGKLNPRVWNDITDAEEVYNLPDTAWHRAADKIIQDASNDLIKTVIICPPDIYGQSATTSNRSTFLVPDYVLEVMKTGEAFYLGQGENVRPVAHIDDLSDLFLLVVRKCLEGGGELDYGKEGLYFAVVDEVPWKRAAEMINQIGQEQGWLPPGAQTVSWDKERLSALWPGNARAALFLWGSNGRAQSARAKRLGWAPRAPSFWESLPEDCRVAAEKAPASATQLLN